MICYKDIIKYYGAIDKNILKNFNIAFAYNSLAIENINVKLSDVKDVFENNIGDLIIHNQKICFNFLIDKILKKEKLSEVIIKKAHKLLTRGTYDERRYNINKERPGEYKKHDYVTGIDEIGVKPEDVNDEMVNLLNDINNINFKNDEDIISMVAYFHNVFEEIHPFADGNGMSYELFIND